MTIATETTQQVLEPLIYDMSVPGRMGVNLPDCDVPETSLPAELLRVPNIRKPLRPRNNR